MLSVHYNTLFKHNFLQNDSSDDSNNDLFALGNENDFDIVIPPTPDTVPLQHNQCD